MDSVEADKARAPVAPPEPISPAPSASAAPTSAPAKPASTTPARTPESAQAPPPASTSAPVATANSATEPAQTISSSTSTATADAAKVVVETKVTESPGAAASTSAPVSQDRAPSPAQPAATTSATAPEPSKESVKQSKDTSPPKTNGHKTSLAEGEPESELSEPGSSVHSPPSVDGFNEPEDEIVVGNRNGRRKSPLRLTSEHEDEVMADADEEPVVSHYPKRKRTSLFNDLSESKIEIPKSVTDDKSPPPDAPKPKPARNSLSGVKGVILGYWRDSPAPDEHSKHAVIGFIDVRDRLRTRIQPINTSGESVANEYPLPPGPGGSWVTFERVVFSKHLVGLDHYQVKEYVRIRSDQFEDTDEERKIAERATVKEAIRRVKLNPANENNPNPPLIAYGLDFPEHLATPNRPDAKRRRVSGGFATINPAPTNGVSQESPASQPHLASQALRPPIDPLPGTRPTRILLGYWKGSSEADPKDRHAVYGILGQNDMFRVKLVRETRDGRFVDGNFPTGAGALWIQYEEVEFEDHLKPLQRLEIKEYCRVRQWQLDHGEIPEERSANEIKAVQEAQVRAGTGYKTINPLIAPAYPAIAPEPSADSVDQSPRAGFGGHELRQSRRVEARTENRPARQPLPDSTPNATPESRPQINRVQSVDALERTNSLARREIARAEAAQGRADRHAANRERAAAAAADAANAAAAAIPAVTTNGRMRFHESEEMQRLNKVWARQESLRVKAGAEDAKIYGGIKYERKSTGPFMGKLVSQGTIISIDGEDYVEYRVLTKPSFF